MSKLKRSMKKLTAPLRERQVRALKCGDEVALSGLVITARDRAHKWLVEEAAPGDLPFDLSGAVVYHCGPLVRRVDDRYEIVAAGPTTSARMNPYMSDVIKNFAVRGIIGKGGMDKSLLAVFKSLGAVYFSAVGGASVLLASKVKKIHGHFKLEEFGTAECFWLLEVDELPLLVTMDTHGKSLHEKVEAGSRRKLENLLGG